MIQWRYNDGGREVAGYKGTAGDCVVRAIAIATGKPYQEVYDELWKLNENQRGRLRGASPRDGGTKKSTIHKYLTKLGWKWTPTMFIGSGCKVHLRKGEMPEQGEHVVQLSRHLTALVDNTIQDTYDPSREGSRCVYGYWSRE